MRIHENLQAILVRIEHERIPFPLRFSIVMGFETAQSNQVSCTLAYQIVDPRRSQGLLTPVSVQISLAAKHKDLEDLWPSVEETEEQIFAVNLDLLLRSRR